MKAGSIIRLLRTADGISQTALAMELGIARTYLSQVENGKVEPGLPLLRAISRRFEIPISLLVIEDTDENPDIIRELQKLLGNLLSARIALKRNHSMRGKFSAPIEGS
jgi:transcriptional regulator with XRE-family HTH domain